MPSGIVEVPTPEATPTSPVTSETADPLLPPGRPTGIAGVDQVIGTILEFDGDYSELERLVRYTSTDCTLQLGMGGPPKCWDIPDAEQVEGFPVVAFPFSVCEGEWQPQSQGPRRILEMLVDPEIANPTATDNTGSEVFGVYTVPEVAEPSDWPGGEYAVVFAHWSGSDVRGSTVRIADGAIVSIEFGCGPVFPAIMAASFADELLQSPLAGLSLAGDGMILAVEELPLWAVEETSPAWRVVIDLEVPVAGYRVVLVDEQTILLRDDESEASVADLRPGKTVAVSGVPLPWSLWRADRIIVDD